MKTNKMMRIASVLLVAVLLTTCVISGTFAKYSTTVDSESSSARVAKWDIDMDGDTALAADFNFDLFDTVKDTAGADEDDVANNSDPADGKNVIAPGTSGSFVIKLRNKSEVTAKYTVTLAETANAGIPVLYSLDNGNTWKKGTELGTISATGTLAMNAGATTDINVMWMWDFENDTNVDTPLGLAGTAEVTVNAHVVVEQVD